MVSAVNWGVVLAHDAKGKARRKWESLRRRMGTSGSKGLTGASLEAAVMAIASADSSLVKIQGAS